jgi:RND family efflux transporter MFP subunit
MKNITKIIGLMLLLSVLIYAGIKVRGEIVPTHAQPTSTMTTSSARFVGSVITADGTVVAQNQAKLNFQTGGKLVYLPHKEGDRVKAGQTIAQLDTYQLKRSLTAALNTYRSNRDTFDQTQQNAQDNVLKPQLTTGYANATYNNDNAVNEAIKRIVDQNQATLDNSVINVELQNYALQLSTITTPISGVITHEDVTVAGVNITPATSFTVADPDSMVFRANIATENIFYLTEGSPVVIAIDGLETKFKGTVGKIYPAKVTLPNGQDVYQVDMVSEDLKNVAKLDESGTVIITTHAENVALVPTWLVLDGKYIWIDDQGTPKLQPITTGKVHSSETEIIKGLSESDKIIMDPKYITALKYKLL